MDWYRLRNYGLWVSIFAIIPLICKGFGLDFLPKNYTQISVAILTTLVLAGIISDPNTENKWYKDDD